MTPEAQRIALAKWEGYRQGPLAYCAGFEIISPEWKTIFYDTDPKWFWPLHVLPDYLGDLNAVHRLEMKLNRPKYKEFQRLLRDLKRPFSATAPQRCEALLKALLLWQDDQPALTEHEHNKFPKGRYTP